MKKHYSAPKAEIVIVSANDILCSSPDWGNGDTNGMNARLRGFILDAEDEEDGY